MRTTLKIGFIGGGNMAEAMIKGMTSHGMKDILVSEPGEERRQYLQKQYSINTTGSNRDVASTCNIIILAVKPQIMDTVANEISETVTDEKTIVSIAAGMTVMSLCECFSDNDIMVVRDIFMSVGEVITLPEKYMDAVTAVSGSGPGFIAFFIEAIIEAGIKAGLGEDNARTLAVQTAIGTTGLLETGMSPSKLREMVTSPGGTTAAGLKTLEEKGLKETVTAAIKSARNRAEELGKQN